MVEYIFSLQLNNQARVYKYVLDLDKKSEDEPEYFFTKSEQQKIKDYFEREIEYSLDSRTIEIIVKRWIADIKLGYRDTKLSLDSSLSNNNNSVPLEDSYYQEIPEYIEPNLLGIQPVFPLLTSLNFIINQ
jgi:hypothetical protein